jgi:hypothetical protein
MTTDLKPMYILLTMQQSSRQIYHLIFISLCPSQAEEEARRSSPLAAKVAEVKWSENKFHKQKKNEIAIDNFNMNESRLKLPERQPARPENQIEAALVVAAATWVNREQ